MHRLLVLVRSVILIGLVSGCEIGARPGPEFTLPEGSVEEGQVTFVSLQCISCHRIKDLDLPAPESEGPVMITLGGGVTKIKSYSELITSIINPSHKLARGFPADQVSQDGESIMTVYNDVMSVSELIDLVTFLQAQYDLIERPGYRYPVYTYKDKE